MSTRAVTDDNFERDVLKADGPVLVDFWAEWCGPCKQIAPALDQISEELGGKVTVAKINIDEKQMTPSRQPRLTIRRARAVRSAPIQAPAPAEPLTATRR